jgi:hypothetical protein
MSSAFAGRGEDKEPAVALIMPAVVPISVVASLRRSSVPRRPVPQSGDTMAHAPLPNAHVPVLNSVRGVILSEVGTRWGKISRQKLSELKTNAPLVPVAKYGAEKTTA